MKGVPRRPPMTWMNPLDPRRPFHDHRWVRADMAAWDAKWAGLRPQTRRAFLNVLGSGREDAPHKIGEDEARMLTLARVLKPPGNKTLVAPHKARGVCGRARGPPH